ncbi:MAG TPA: division/cell wall cluster transcriptional repressor MraZ [Gammaproteobacteria bacterium]|nr:division/cell wall cluster transcriptional repressor MraZ [Gammaproteobacteria bacterium]
MFRGFSAVSIDAKGRLALPSRYRQAVAAISGNQLVVTLNPLDRCLWLYPLPAWQAIEEKLAQLSDFDKQSRRTKQMMRGHATECELDGHGRVLLPPKLREFAGLKRDGVLLGQSNKFELWDEAAWNRQRDDWLGQVGEDQEAVSSALRDLSL